MTSTAASLPPTLVSQSTWERLPRHWCARRTSISIRRRWRRSSSPTSRTSSRLGVSLVDHEELVYDKERDVERVFLDFEDPPAGCRGELDSRSSARGSTCTEHKAARKAHGRERAGWSRSAGSAAGVTHEINTSIQFLKDTLSFLSRWHAGDGSVHRPTACDRIPRPLTGPRVTTMNCAREIPACARSHERRPRAAFAEIVRSMKEFFASPTGAR